MLVYLRNILQLILSPARGWEDVSAGGSDTLWLFSRCLVPMMAFAALTVFVKRFFDVSLTFVVMFEQALVVFASLFVSYFFACTMFRTFAYRFCDGEPNDTKFTTVTTYIISLCALSQIFFNLLPVDIGLNVLLPLCIAMVLWKAEVYLGVSQRGTAYFVLFGFMVSVLPPFMLIALFNMLIH